MNHSNFMGYSKEELQLRYTLFKRLQKLSNRRWIFRFSEFILNLPLIEYLPIMKSLYLNFFTGKNLESSLQKAKRLFDHTIYSMIDYAVEHSKNEKEQYKTYNLIKDIIVGAEEHAFGRTGGFVLGVPIKITGLSSPDVLKNEKKEGITLMKYDILLNRLRSICNLALAAGLKIFIDAEESWFQDTIDQITLKLMEEFNKKECIVFGTIQFYRIDSLEILERYLEWGRSKKVFIGIKAVRGAYHDIEIAYAKKRKIKPIVFEKKEDTDKNFDRGMELALSNINFVEYSCATHNENSVVKCINFMKKMGINEKEGKVTFAQLYGMADWLTLKIREEGAIACKYLPFGDFRKALKYLIRRAKENSSSPEMIKKELTYLEKEIRGINKLEDSVA